MILNDRVVFPRDYQLECVGKIREYFRNGHRYALVHMPTGSGKTVTACEFIREMLSTYPAYRVCVVVPKLAIIDSFVTTLATMLPNTPVTVAAASSHGKNMSGQIIVGSYQTLARMRVLPEVDLVLADEAHRINERDQTSQYYRLIRTLMPTTDTRLLALTATPFRDTGYIYGQEKIFKELVFSRDLLWTTEMGFTVKAVLQSGREAAFDTSILRVDNTGEYSQGSLGELVLDEKKARAQVRDIINRTPLRKKIAIATANIEHAELIKRLLEEQNEKVEIVHSEQDWDEREISLGNFQTDARTRFLVFISIVAEGFDYPPIDAIALLRPTRRANLYVQVVGRGLRPFPGKIDCLVLDYGNVIKNCGPLNAPFINEAGGKRGLEKAKALSNIEVVQCQNCGGFFFPSVNDYSPKCTHCEVLHTKAAPDPGKNLRKKAATDEALYSESIAKKKRIPRQVLEITVSHVNYKPFVDTDRRLVSIYAKEYPGREFKFFLEDPARLSPNEFWRIKKIRELEPKLSLLMNDIAERKFDLKSPRATYGIIPEKEIKLTITVSSDGKDWADYRSHEVVGPNWLPSDTTNEEEDLARSARRVFGSKTKLSYIDIHGEDEGA